MTASLTISDVVEQSGLSQDVVRELADTGQLPCIRTPGGHRRFDPAVVDAFLRAQSRSAARGAQAASTSRWSAAQSAAATHRSVRDPDQIRDDSGIDERDHDVRSDPWPSRPDEAAVQADDAARLHLLKQHGERQIPYGTSATARSAVIEALDGYVTTKRFPGTAPLWDTHSAITAKVAAILEPFGREQREQAAAAARAAATALAAQLASIERARNEATAGAVAAQEKQAAHAEREAEHETESRTRRAARQTKINDLVAHGRSYVQTETTGWDVRDRLDARAEVERALVDEVEADWRRRDVKDLVDEILDEWCDPDESENSM